MFLAAQTERRISTTVRRKSTIFGEFLIMGLSHIAFVMFAAFSALRMFSYLPQIWRVAIDTNGAMAISYSTWSMWIGANVATALYAAVNLHDFYLASVSVVYATCCTIVIVLTVIKRHHFRHAPVAKSGPRAPAARQARLPMRAKMGLAMFLVSMATVAVALGAERLLPLREPAERSALAAETSATAVASERADQPAAALSSRDETATTPTGPAPRVADDGDAKPRSSFRQTAKRTKTDGKRRYVQDVAGAWTNGRLRTRGRYEDFDAGL